MVKFFYDTETTGTNWNRHSVHQIGGLIEVNDEVVEEVNVRVKPHPKAILDPVALKTGNVTEKQIMAYQDIPSAHKEIRYIMEKYVNKYDSKDKIKLIGFNNRAFDDYFFRKLFDLAGDPYFGSLFWVDSVDTLSMASEYLESIRHTMPSFKLKRVAMTLGMEIAPEELHTATYDAKLVRFIYRHITNRDLM